MKNKLNRDNFVRLKKLKTDTPRKCERFINI